MGEADESADDERDAPGEHDDEGPHACPRHPDSPVQGTCSRCGGFYCAVCLRRANRPSDSLRCPNCEPEAPEPRTIGGWLILPAIGLVVTFGQALWVALSELPVLGSDVPGIAALVVAEEVVYLGLAAMSAVAAYHFFQKKKRAIALMIAFYATGFGVAIFEVLSMLYLESLGLPLPFDGVQVARGLVMPLIWIAYFTNSTRVRETFVLD